jgi:eukaryotic-like serine/threonine-protein kinase
MIGSTVGTYRITGVIGVGGMGTVYSAEHTLLGRPAAVKILLPEYSKDPAVVTRLFNEARATTASRHPGIIEIFDFGWHVDGTAYIVMEHLVGESLAARLRRGRMPLEQVFSIGRQIANALTAAHQNGIVHRDLKPDNVYLVPDPEVADRERVKLLDFGIAKLQHAGVDQQTRLGAVIGTPTYMAPEQCRGVAIDHRADLYSLGCILFELLGGRPPFVGEGMGDVLGAHIHVPAPPIASLVPDVPPAVAALVDRLLLKDPAQRIQTAAEVTHQIDSIIGAPWHSSAPRTSTPNVAAPPLAPTTLSGAAGAYGRSGAPSRSRLPIWLAVAGGVVGVGIAIMLATTSEKHERTSDTQSTPTGSSSVGTMSVVSIDAGAAAVTADAASAVTTSVTTSVTPDAAVAGAPTLDARETVEIKLASVPPGAQVVVKGEVLGVTPRTIELPASRATETITFRLAGYRDAHLQLRLDASVEKTVKLHEKSKSTSTSDRGVNPF